MSCHAAQPAVRTQTSWQQHAAALALDLSFAAHDTSVASHAPEAPMPVMPQLPPTSCRVLYAWASCGSPLFVFAALLFLSPNLLSSSNPRTVITMLSAAMRKSASLCKRRHDARHSKNRKDNQPICKHLSSVLLADFGLIAASTCIVCTAAKLSKFITLSLPTSTSRTADSTYSLWKSKHIQFRTQPKPKNQDNWRMLKLFSIYITSTGQRLYCICTPPSMDAL